MKLLKADLNGEPSIHPGNSYQLCTHTDIYHVRVKVCVHTLLTIYRGCCPDVPTHQTIHLAQWAGTVYHKVSLRRSKWCRHRQSNNIPDDDVRRSQLTTECGVFIKGIRAVNDAVAELTNLETLGAIVAWPLICIACHCGQWAFHQKVQHHIYCTEYLDEPSTKQQQSINLFNMLRKVSYLSSAVVNEFLLPVGGWVVGPVVGAGVWVAVTTVVWAVVSSWISEEIKIY